MVVSGIFLKSREARIVTLDGTKASHQRIANNIHKLSLPKNPTQNDVVQFRQAFIAYCQDHAIESVIINKRTTSGQAAVGGSTFITEGMLLSICEVPIRFVHNATVRATNRKEASLKTEKPDTVDLGIAYDYAFEGLS